MTQTERISRQNADLRQRAVSASSRATAQTERAIRRIGFDLHDGPAQYLALAALRLDNALANQLTSPENVEQVRGSLAKALEELRINSRGLALPDLDELGILELVKLAVQDHEKQTGMVVDLTIPAVDQPALNDAQKLLCFQVLARDTLEGFVANYLA